MNEHSVQQPISAVAVMWHGNNHEFCMGQRTDLGVITRIEACEKSGMYSNIPYVRVWCGEDCFAEYCQHNIIGVYFDRPTTEQSNG